ncbi:MAG: hypothetical protein KAV87_55660 [Desulfobacteraceae bacterium]|nr:hypothetical protein [Desulfobacteraceae bacterium]
MDITSFFNTEDAIVFGVNANRKKIIAMARKREIVLQNVDFLRKQGNLQSALDEACRAQLLRKAIESYYESH